MEAWPDEPLGKSVEGQRLRHQSSRAMLRSKAVQLKACDAKQVTYTTLALNRQAGTEIAGFPRNLYRQVRGDCKLSVAAGTEHLGRVTVVRSVFQLTRIRVGNSLQAIQGYNVIHDGRTLSLAVAIGA